MGAAGADENSFSRKLLLPNGAPAAGARVLVHRVPIRRESPYKWLVANAQGVVRVDKRDLNEPTDSFAMIDAPGCALNFWTNFHRNTELELKADTPLRGRVVDNAGRPVANATVLVREFDTIIHGSWAVNLSSRKNYPSQLVTHTAKDGRFVLRGIATEDYPQIRVGVLMQAKIKGHTWGGLSSLTLNTKPAQENNDIKLVVRPPVVIQGRALNATTGKPLANVIVRLHIEHLMELWTPPVENIVTGRDGKFVFEASPPAKDWKVSARAKGFTMVGAQLLAKDLDRRRPEQVFNVTLPLRPLVTLRGRVVDTDTARPPVARVIVVSRPLGIATKQGLVTVFEHPTGAASKDDGTFQISDGAGRRRVEVGAHFHISFGCKGMISNESFYSLESPQEVTVGAKDQEELLLRVRKNPGVLMRFERLTASRGGSIGESLSIELRTPDGKVQSLGFGPLFFIPTNAWGEEMEIRVSSFKDELVPWTRLVADGAKWPVVISSPISKP